MFKVFVVVFGLVALVPSADKKSLTVLLLNSDGLVSGQVQHLEHTPKIALRSSSGLREKIFNGDDIEFTATRRDDVQEVTVNTERMPLLVNIVGKEAARIHPGCTSINWARDCRFHGRRLVAGRVKFNGGWSVKALEVIQGNGQPSIRDRSIWGFRSLVSGEEEESLRGEFANGFLIEVTVDDATKVSVTDGTESFNLGNEPDNICQPFAENGTRCSKVILSNGASNPPSGQTELGFVDTHFEVLYSLLADQRSEPFVPFLKEKKPLEGGPGNPPGSKCFGGLLEP